MRPRSIIVLGLWLCTVACGSESAATSPAPAVADRASAKPGSADPASPPPDAPAHADGAASPGAGQGSPGIPAAPAEPAGAEDLASLTPAAPGKAYGQILIEVRNDANATADLTIVRSEGVRARPGTVPYTADPKVVVGIEATRLSESKLLGAAVAVDLDGDGATKGAIKVRCDQGVLVLQTKPERRMAAVTEFTDDVVRFEYGPDAQRLVANPGSGAALYSPCGKGHLTFGVDTQGPLAMHGVASPAVFVVYRAKLDAADAADPFTLQTLESGGKPVEHAVYSFREYDVRDSGEVEVFAAHLVVFPIDATAALQRVSLALSGQTPEFITASINEVDEAGTRIRYADGFKRFAAR